MKIEVIVEKTSDGYSGYYTFENNTVVGIGDTFMQLKEDINKATELAIMDIQPEIAKKIKTAKFEFILSVSSVFELFPTLNISGFAKYIGINSSLLRQYSKGIKKPSEKRSAQILHGINELGKHYQQVKY